MEETFTLCAKSIDQASEVIAEFLKSLNMEALTITKNRLLAEEILLTWMEHSVGEKFILSCGKKWKKPYLYLQMEGIPYNPVKKEESENSYLTQSLMCSFGFSPSYTYKNGVNQIQFNIEDKKKNQLVVIFISIALGLFSGIIVKFLLPSATADFFLDSVINPLYSTIFRLLGLISGPLILLSVTWGIYGIGDAADFQYIGKNVLTRFLTVIFLIAALCTCSFPIFHFTFDTSQQDMSAIKEIVEMVLDIIPSNIISPLEEGNTLQIIFVAILFGVAMIFLRKRVSSVADFVEQMNYIIQFSMGCISKMLPHFIFLIMFRLVLSDMLSSFIHIWKLFLIYLIAVLAICAVNTCIVSVRYKVSPLKIIRKSLPTFLISFTTASSSAAFSSNMETCEKKFGIDQSLCSFGIPLGMVMCKTATVAYYILISLFFAKQYGVAVSIPWLISVAFVSAMLAIATPPIPGGGTSAYTMLFAKLLIPDDALAIVLSVDIIFDFFRTAFNLYNLPLILIQCANSMKKLNKDTLRS